MAIEDKTKAVKRVVKKDLGAVRIACAPKKGGK